MRPEERRKALSASLAAVAGLLALTSPGSLYAGLVLYVDGSPAPDSVCYWAYEPLPTLGIHSSTTESWSGRIHSSEFALANMQIDYSKVPSAWHVPYNEPYGYRMFADLVAQSGVQFTVDLHSEGVGQTLVTLYDGSSDFDVPVDTLFVYQGGPTGIEASAVNADAGGPYQVVEGNSVVLDATGSTITIWVEGEPDPFTHNVSGGTNLPYWSVGGTNIAFGLTPTITCAELTAGLGLDLGVYELALDLTTPFGRGTAVTTIEIVPEPLSAALFGLGGLLAILGRRARGR